MLQIAGSASDKTPNKQQLRLREKKLNNQILFGISVTLFFSTRVYMNPQSKRIGRSQKCTKLNEFTLHLAQRGQYKNRFLNASQTISISKSNDFTLHSALRGQNLPCILKDLCKCFKASNLWQRSLLRSQELSPNLTLSLSGSRVHTKRGLSFQLSNTVCLRVLNKMVYFDIFLKQCVSNIAQYGVFRVLHKTVC